MINAGVRTADELDIWSDGRLSGLNGNGRFLEPRFSVRITGEGVGISTEPEMEGKDGFVTYELKVRLSSIIFAREESSGADLSCDSRW